MARVKDGDSFSVVRSSGVSEEVRVFGIDAPERGQPWSRRAREALAKRVDGKVVRIEPVELDQHDRIVAWVHVGSACVGCEQVRAGNAWVYRHYTDSKVLLELEAEARAARRGLWSLPANERIPPWEWRHGQRKPEAPLSAVGAECGLARLDGDRDGVPCEMLCSR